MPEMRFAVRWPDETVTSCYSPSLVVREHLEPGRAYSLDDFLERSRTALTIASDRVREKYGVPCVRAEAQLREIEALARRFAGDGEAIVRVLPDPPLPF